MTAPPPSSGVGHHEAEPADAYAASDAAHLADVDPAALEQLERVMSPWQRMHERAVAAGDPVALDTVHRGQRRVLEELYGDDLEVL